MTEQGCIQVAGRDYLVIDTDSGHCHVAGYHQWRVSKINSVVFALAKILPKDAFGRFRLRLLQGLQSARYAPVEFLVVPKSTISPAGGEFERCLYTSENPPTIQVWSPEAANFTSDTGRVYSTAAGAYQVEFPHCASEFTANLQFGHFGVPLRWRPHILRGGIARTGEVVEWTSSAPVFQEDALSVSHTLHIEGIPEAIYDITANGVSRRTGNFGFDAHLQFSLAEFKESIRDLPADEIWISLNISFNGCAHELPLLVVFRSCAAGGRAYGGELVGELRAGQKIVHSDYGEGTLEAFALKAVNGWEGHTARFRFSRYEGVHIFIPTSRRVPVFWDVRPHVGQTRSTVWKGSQSGIHT